MALFKLPVITIGRKAPGGAQPVREGGAGAPFHPGGEELRRQESPEMVRIGSDAGAGGATAIPSVLRRTESKIARAEGRNLPAYSDPPTMFLDNAKEVIARCIQAGIIGDSSAREFFRRYSAYLEEEPEGGVEDFLSFAYQDNEEQCIQIASMLNSSLDYPLTRLDVEPSQISAGTGGVLEGELLSFCQKMRIPLLAASTADLLIFGVCNPYLSRHAEAAFRAEVVSLEHSYRYYLLLSPSQMKAAVEKLH